MSVVPQQAAPPLVESKVQPSHVLPRLARRLKMLPHPRVLDLGSVVGGNLQFFIDLGCKVTADDLLKPVNTIFKESGEAAGNGKGPPTLRLEHADALFEAVIAWDMFDFLPPVEAKAFARDLHRVVKPGGLVLAYFTTRESERRDPQRRYRIQGTEKVEWLPVGSARSLRHVYQNRDIERMFEGFKTHAAFVLQNGTREMLLEKKAPAPAQPVPAAPASPHH
jgi:cyclopropane fatty-acyl-phospholipid synthase-like methyltransferase